jgi:hypothetical protein
MDRRRLLIFSAAFAAAPGAALADVTRTPLPKAFQFLDAYLGLPPGERSRFYLAYRAMKDKRPYPGAQAFVVAPNGSRLPLPVDRTGLVTALPSLILLKSGAVLESADPELKLGVELRPTIPVSTRVDVGQLNLSLAQVNAAVAKIAGPLSLVAPKLDCAYFPDSGGGQAVTAGGQSAALASFPVPTIGPVPYFIPARLAGAQTVVLARAPSRILLGARPKGT